MAHPLAAHLSPTWTEALSPRVDAGVCERLLAFVAQERARAAVHPKAEDVFAAFHSTALPDARVVILGQDPYHGPGQAHGLAFSVLPGVKPPPSLANIYKELVADVGGPRPRDGSLTRWSTQGVMLLNAVLTVREGSANSHANQGWEAITDATIDALSARIAPLVFVLWGASARKKAKRIDAARHRIVEGAHPSPLSAYQGFFGSRPFSAVNAHLRELGLKEIDWCQAGSE
jgi:uracil-DNA glycosylase